MKIDVYEAAAWATGNVAAVEVPKFGRSVPVRSYQGRLVCTPEDLEVLGCVIRRVGGVIVGVDTPAMW